MKTVFVTGTNRGLGLGFVDHLLKENYRVLATCRDLNQAPELRRLQRQFPESLEVFEVDLLTKDFVDRIKSVLRNRAIDIFINNAGAMGPKNQDFQSISLNPWVAIMHVNVMAPLLIAQSIVSNLVLGHDKKMFFLSSRVGSISENTGGGRYIYRSSKSALNQVVKSLSIDLLSQEISAVALHPGWVLTDMGGPNALVTVDESIRGMIKVIERVSLNDSGKFFNYDGKEISW
ncbi:MAG: SDR family oxidoreductase [Pseudomonadota bacterium]|nr:SDR family oxidoreductase [Pseudomonadota bacterium]